MPPRKTTDTYRSTTELERQFLRIVTRGHSELEQQIESCEIAEYDATGWCHVNVREGPSSPYRMVDGPTLDVAGSEPSSMVKAPIDTILWITDAGLLYTVEVITYGDDVSDPYRLFVDAAQSDPKRLRYPRG